MDFKKNAFSNQFSYCVSSPRRKVVSGFGLWILTSFIFLSVVLFNISFKAPILNPIFRGFNKFGSNNTSLLSWPLSVSTTISSSSSTNFTTTGLEKSGDLMQGTREERVRNESNEASATGIFLDSNGKEMVLEKIHVVDLSDKDKSGNFTVEEGRFKQKTHEVNGSEIDKNGKGVVLEKSLLGNFSENVKNGSFTVGDVILKETIEVKNGNKSSVVVSTDKLNGSIGKVSEDGNVGNQGTSFEKINTTALQSDFQHMKRRNVPFGECDIFDGRWVRDDTKPYYPAGSCPYIDRDFDCHLNGRPDDEFLKWKWQPNECDIPSLNATDFLERLRGKKLVFVGDSLNRNMWESLVCILRHSVRDKKRVYEISGKTKFKKKGFYAFLFEDYNCSVDFVSAPFLVRESSFKGRNGSFDTLRLDLMDKTTSMYHDADVVVFNTGHWWTHEKTSRGEDYYQVGNQVYPRLKVLEAYKRALSTWARWVDKNIDSSRTQVIFRGYSMTHFRGGQWNSGGQCDKETEPIFNEAHLAKYPSKMRAFDHVLQEIKTPIIYLNISRLTDYRKDGHPSIYRMKYKTVKEQIAAERSQDCSHWCLPGVPDTWNELLYASLLKIGRGSWRR